MEHTSIRWIIFAIIVVLFFHNYGSIALLHESLDTDISDSKDREFAKDITSLIVESTLKSKCDGNVFIISKECENYIDHALKSISDWAPPGIVVSFKDYPTISDKSKRSWNFYLSWERRPCSLIFICDLLLKRNNNREVENISTPSTSTIGEELMISKTLEPLPLGYVEFLNFFTSQDQILYFQAQWDNTCPTTEVFGLSNSPEQCTYFENRLTHAEKTEGIILKRTGVLLSIIVEKPTDNPEAIMQVYSKCDFCGPGPRRHQNYLGHWQRNKTIFGRFFDTFDQFQKVSFNNSNVNIGYFNYPPHFRCHMDVSDSKACEGVEWEIVSQMGNYLKFNFTLLKMSIEESQNVTSESNFTQMIEALQNDQIDLAVGGISVTSQRIAIVDFSNVFATEPIVFVVEKTNNIFVLGIWLAFQVEVWPLILLLITIISLLFRVIINRKTLQPSQNQFNKNFHQNLSLSILLDEARRIPEKKPAHVAIFESLQITLQPLVSQPLSPSQISHNPRRLLKMLLITWWFTCLIISTFYNTSLITSLINPVTAKEPESLKELLDSGYRFKLGCKHGAVYELIASVTDKQPTEELEERGDQNTKGFPKEKAKMVQLLQQVRERLIENSQSYNGLTAYIIEESAIKRVTWSNLDIGFNQIKIIRERLFLTGYGFALKPQAAYKEKIDTALARFDAGGFLFYWYSWFILKSKELGERKLRLREKLGQVRLDLEILQGAFIFLIFGLSFAAIVFGLEHFTKQYTFRFYTRKQIFTFLKAIIRHLTWFYNKHVAEKPLDEKNKKNQRKFVTIVNTVVKINNQNQHKFLK